jgi:hypothetical protein
MFIWLIFTQHTQNENFNKIQILCEIAYYEGQKDAINNDIRIKLLKDNKDNSFYVWIKSPWNTDKEPTINFIPNDLDMTGLIEKYIK